MFPTLSYKTNAHASQDLYDSKQCRFCPHAPLQSTQNETSLGEALKNKTLTISVKVFKVG